MSDSITITQRCEAFKKNGHRCTLNTRKGTHCWIHLKYQHGLRIKKSLIPDAGLGLYTTIPRVRGENIAEYSGDIIEDDNFGSNYALQIKQRPKTFIDARRSNTGEGRYSNNKPSGNNAQLVYDRRKREAHVRARVPIPKDNEIYTAYGRNYWLQDV